MDTKQLEKYKFIPNWNNDNTSNIDNWNLIIIPVNYHGINSNEIYLIYKSPELVKEFRQYISDDFHKYKSLHDFFMDYTTIEAFLTTIQMSKLQRLGLKG